MNRAKRWKEKVVNSKKLKVKTGDIIKVPDYGYYPKYAKGEYALVSERFKSMKDVGSFVYQDYYVILTMLSGKHIGRSRTYALRSGQLSQNIVSLENFILDVAIKHTLGNFKSQLFLEPIKTEVKSFLDNLICKYGTTSNS